MMEMTRLKLLKRKKGFSYVMTAVCLIAVLLIGTGIFEGDTDKHSGGKRARQI